MKRLFVDLDNVMADFNSAACDWFNHEIENNKVYSDKYRTLKSQDLIHYQVYECYGFPDSEGEYLRQTMFGDAEFWQTMPPVFGAHNALKRLSKKYEIFVATAPRYNGVCVQERVDWLKIHFPFIPERHIVFTQFKGILHGDIMIDDNVEYLLQFQGKRILYLQPYNQSSALLFGYTVANWKELEELLNGIL